MPRTGGRRTEAATFASSEPSRARSAVASSAVTLLTVPVPVNRSPNCGGGKGKRVANTSRTGSGPRSAAAGQGAEPKGSASQIPGRAAAERAGRHDTVAVKLPVLGEIKLPRPQDTAYYAGIGALTALELIEWPAAVALAVGHVLLGQQQHKRLQEFGEALEEV